MGRVLGKMKRTISVLLAAAMIVTALPQTSALAYASEAQDVLGEGGDGAQTEIIGEDNENDNTENSSVDAGKENDSEESDVSDEDGAETDISDEVGLDENDQDKTGTTDETESGETESPEEVQNPEEDEADESLTEDAEAEEPEVMEVPEEAEQQEDSQKVSVMADAGETTKVNINIPTFYNKDNATQKTSFLTALRLEYVVGGKKKTQSVTSSDLRKGVVSIDAAQGEALQLRLRLHNRAVIDEVSYKTADGEKETLKEGQDDAYITYTIDSVPADCEIDIKADFYYSIRFVDIYASQNPGEKSVAFYQYAQGDTENDSESHEDMIGRTVELSGAELKEYFTNYNYVLETQEGFTFYSIETSASGLECSKDKESKTQDRYVLSGNYDLGAENFTVYILAEPTKKNSLTFNVPAELKNKAEITVIGKSPAGTTETKIPDSNGIVEFDNDTDVSFYVKLQNDLNHTVRVTGREDGADVVELLYDTRTMITDDGDNGVGWETYYKLRDEDLWLKNGDITVNLSQVSIYPVNFHMDPDKIDRIYVEEPSYKVYYGSNVGELENLTIYVAENESLRFSANTTTSGRLKVSTSEDGYNELKAEDLDELDHRWYYTVVPTEAMDLYLSMAEYRFIFDYSESDVSVQMLDVFEGLLDLGEDHIYSSEEDQHTFHVFVKPNDSTKACSVYYHDSWDDLVYAEIYEYSYDYEDAQGDLYRQYEEAGYLCYEVRHIRASTFEDAVITIESASMPQGHHVTIDSNNEDIYVMLLEKDEYLPSGWDSIGYIYDDFYAWDGEDIYFTIEGYNSNTHWLEVDLTSAGGDRLETCGTYGGMPIYRLTSTADATLTIKTTERPQYTVMVESTENVTDFTVKGAFTRPDDETEKTGRYLVREGESIVINGICNDGSVLQEGYRPKVLCTAGGETYEVPMLPVGDDDEGWYFNFNVEVTGNMTLTIDAVATSSRTLSFTGTDQLETIRVWEFDKTVDGENLYDAQTQQAVVTDDKCYYFDVQPQDGYAVDSVVMKDKESGSKTELQPDSNNRYLLGASHNDAEITVNMVAGYTVKFDVPEGVDIYFAQMSGESRRYVDKTTYCYVPVADGFRIGLDEYDINQYKLLLDSEVFEIAEGSTIEEYVEYVISPVQGADLPSTVTVRAEEYATHTVTLDYPEGIKSIYLEYANGESIKISDKQAKVQGPGIVFGVKAIQGYAPEVSIQGSGEVRTLVPFRMTESEASEYYIDKITEDTTITVTLNRSYQKLTYYAVGFYCEGNRAKIRDAVTQLLYTANTSSESADDDWYYEYPYSVLKGGSISFTVEAKDGYEMDGVYVNGEAVQPVQRLQSQQDIYTVVPPEDYTMIDVRTRKIEKTYPVTFTYPDTVESVKVRGYELQDNALNVKEGVKLYFTVELADKSHSITSVKMNGKNVPFNQNEGCYILTTLEEAMKVEITTAAVDKKVRFNKNVVDMTYSVVTGDKVNASETADTYIVSADAGELRFTVTSSRKESVPTVTYISTVGGKTTLAGTDRKETDSGISYTYVIPASELPIESEIVIGETNTASREDREKLENAISSYTGKYNEKDYTEDSWAVFAEALENAQTCLNKEDVTTAEINAAIADLEKAVKGLTKISEDPKPPTPVTKEGLWFEILENDGTADGSYIYTGAAIKPEIKVYFGNTPLEVKKDYTVAYKNNTNAGPATITVTGKGNFKGNATATFEIKKKDIDAEDISVADVYAIINNKGKVTNPKVTVKFGKKTLKLNNDYAVTYPDLETEKDEAGNDKIVAKDYEITISTTAVKKDKKGNLVDSVNYTGSRTIKYTVRSNDTQLMSKAVIQLKKTKVDYAGVNGADTEQPGIKSIKIGGKDVPDTEYTVSYDDNWNKIGKATVTVTANKGSVYYGSKSVTYTVNGTKLAAKELTIEGINATYDYTGDPIYVSANGSNTGSLKVTRIKGNDSPKELKEGEDYTVSYATGKKVGEHTNVGTVTVTITGINAYTGSIKRTFKIAAVDLAKFNPENPENALAGRVFSADSTAKYTKTGAKPGVTELTFNGVTLEEKKDYTISYSANTKVKLGQKSATMTIKGKGNFTGKLIHKYEVTMGAVIDGAVTATATDIVKPTKFNQVKTTVKVVEQATGKALKAGTDYEKTITYYSDAECTTPITADNFNKAISEDNSKTPTDVDSVIYAKIVMKGNYAGTDTQKPEYITASFRVYDKDLKLADAKKFTVEIDTTKTRDGADIKCDTSSKKNPFYTGTDIEPKVIVKTKGTNPVTLEEGTHYRVEYSNNINKGKAKVTVIGIGGGYGGSKSVTFTIVPKNMEWAEQAVKQAAEFLSNLMFAPN